MGPEKEEDSLSIVWCMATRGGQHRQPKRMNEEVEIVEYPCVGSAYTCCGGKSVMMLAGLQWV